jgi:hypothetical protein
VVGRLTLQFERSWKVRRWVLRCVADMPAAAQRLCSVVNTLTHGVSAVAMLRALEDGRSVHAQGWYVANAQPDDADRVQALREHWRELTGQAAGEDVVLIGLVHEREKCAAPRQVVIDLVRACMRRAPGRRRP